MLSSILESWSTYQYKIYEMLDGKYSLNILLVSSHFVENEITNLNSESTVLKYIVYTKESSSFSLQEGFLNKFRTFYLRITFSLCFLYGFCIKMDLNFVREGLLFLIITSKSVCFFWRYIIKILYFYIWYKSLKEI